MRSWVPFVALSLALRSLPAAAAPKVPVFSSELELVKVAVTVRDAHGEVVGNLKPEDFALTEDGRPQEMAFFARAVDPEGSADDREQALTMDLGLLLDTSASMQNELRLSQQAAIRFLESIPRARDLITIFFDSNIRLSHYDSEHQQGLFDQILENKAGDRTAFYDAVSVYLSRVADAPGRKVAVLFTDGVDTASSVRFSELLDMARASSVLVYAIGFKGDNAIGVGGVHPVSGDSVLHRLASITGGTAYFPGSYRDIPKIYDKILAELSGQYVLGFSSTNHNRDGKFRKLKVTVRNPAFKVQHREGYYAPQAPKAAAAQ